MEKNNLNFYLKIHFFLILIFGVKAHTWLLFRTKRPLP